MRTVESVIKELSGYPLDALCYAYEGEGTGIVVVEKTKKKRTELGFIHACEYHPCRECQQDPDE